MKRYVIFNLIPFLAISQDLELFISPDPQMQGFLLGYLNIAGRFLDAVMFL